MPDNPFPKVNGKEIKPQFTLKGKKINMPDLTPEESEARQLAISQSINERYAKALKAMADPDGDHCLCSPLYCKRCEAALERGIQKLNDELERLRAEVEYYKSAWEPRCKIVLDEERFNRFKEAMDNPAPPNESMKKVMNNESKCPHSDDKFRERWCDGVAQAPHTCPYGSEIDGDDETLCTCCEGCENECAMDI